MRPEVGQGSRKVVIQAGFGAVYILTVKLEKKRKMLLAEEQIRNGKTG